MKPSVVQSYAHSSVEHSCQHVSKCRGRRASVAFIMHHLPRVSHAQTLPLINRQRYIAIRAPLHRRYIRLHSWLFAKSGDAPSDIDTPFADRNSTTPWSRFFRVFTPSEWPKRFQVVLLCFVSFVICNCDRINISVAILPMAQYYGWSQTTVGIIQSAFFWGYVLTQIPGGYLADLYGGKQVLAAGVITWSAMTLLTPLAASSNIGLLLLVRASLGFGEGVAMPAMNNIIAKWVPERERSRSLSLTYSGMYLGSVIGLWLCPTFIVQFGWQSVFYIFGGIGFFWWIAWQFLTTSTPEECRSMSGKERAYIAANMPRSRPTPPTSAPWRMLFSQKATWAIIVAHFCTTWGKSRSFRLWSSPHSPYKELSQSLIVALCFTSIAHHHYSFHVASSSPGRTH